MRNFMIALFETSIAMSVIALVYISVTPLLSKKFTAKGRYYAWLIIIIGLIIPFRFQLQVSAIYVDALIPTLKTVYSQSINLAVSDATVSSSIFPWYMLTGGIWISGVIIFMAFHIIRHRRFLKMVKRWSTEVVDSQALNMLHDIQAKLQIKKPVDLQVCPGISSPMLLGFIRPTILFPEGDIPEDELPLIFKHELIHFKRRDLWYKVLVFLASSLHWFNPFVYMMAREISIQCELSCDEEVVKNTDSACRQKYVEAIIGVIRKQSKAQSKFSTNFYSGKQGMKHRVFSIMDAGSKKWGISILAVMVVATLSTGTMLKVNAPKFDPISSTSVSKVVVSPEEGSPVNQLSDPVSPVDKDGTVSDPSASGDANVYQLVPDKDETASEHEIPMNRLIEGKLEVDKDGTASEHDIPKLITVE